MVQIIQTSQLTPDYLKALDPSRKLWLYNGLDTALTAELHSNLEGHLDPETTGVVYNFERAMMGPAFTMMRRGFRIDMEARDRLLDEMRPRLLALGGLSKDAKGKGYVANEAAIFQQLAIGVHGEPINYNSPKQLAKLFYETLRIPEIKVLEKGRYKVSTNREALEKIAAIYPRGEALARSLLAIRDLERKISVLETGVGEDGRMRCSYNIAGTETGRWSSSESVFGSGTNLQNITKELRQIFIPDDGYVLFNIDLKSAESVAVGALADDRDYVRDCLESDVHTLLARRMWPDKMAWTGDISADKELCDTEKYDRHMTYRDMIKRGGHGTNYLLTPMSLARNLKISLSEATRFQLMYYGGEIDRKTLERWGYSSQIEGTWKGNLLSVRGAYPNIREWHKTVLQELETKGYLVNPFGRRRTFWGRRNEASTLREAVAFLPQSTVGDALNIGLYRVWKHLEPKGLQLFGQVHDSIVGQVREDQMHLLAEAREQMKVAIPFRMGAVSIPASVEVGQNWQKVEKWVQ